MVFSSRFVAICSVALIISSLILIFSPHDFLAHLSFRWFIREASNKDADFVFSELVSLLGENAVSRDTNVLLEHAVDRSRHPAGSPDIVVWPETTSDVQVVVAICRKHKMIVIPMGFRSSLEGQIIAYSGGVIVDMMKMKAVHEIHEDDFQATVGPGLRINELNEILAPLGFFFPVSPASFPSIGGAVSTRASGTTTVMYGTMRENVIRLEVVLPNGEVIWTRSRAPKSSAGYDLTNLFIGSEGTLGIVTRVTVRLVRPPESMSACVVNYKSLTQAARTVHGLRRTGISSLARMEILNADGIRVVNAFHNLSMPELPTLFLEFHGRNDDEVAKAASIAQEISNEAGGSNFQFTIEESERKALWFARNNYFYAASNYRKNCVGGKCQLHSTDVSVPISHFVDVIIESEKDFTENCNLFAPLVGHAGDGNFHISSPIDGSDEEEIGRFKECHHRLVKRAIEAGGTCSGEHGIGVSKMEELVWEHGAEAVKLMKDLKKAIDPFNMMNPGKML